MRITFKDTDHVKKAGRLLSRLSGIKYMIVLNILSRTLGYESWYEFEHSFSCDSALSVEKEAQIIYLLSQSLKIEAGDVQHILAVSRMFKATQERHISLRMKVFEKSGIRTSNCFLTVLGRKIRGLSCNDTVVTDEGVFRSEKVITIGEPTVPARLWIPYGIWTEKDNSKVLFSRDYMPLWRLKPGFRPERLKPSIWIQKIKQDYLWNDMNKPWFNDETYQNCCQLLSDVKINSLPVLVDYLPDLIKSKTYDDWSMEIKGYSN